MADETAVPEASRAERPAVQTAGLTRFAMIFLFLLGMWAIFDQNFRGAFGAAAGALLWPLIGFGGQLPVLTILLAGLLTTTISSILRDRLTDWVKMARTQKILRALQKDRLDAVRKGNKAKIEQLTQYQTSIQKDLMEVQFAPMKSTALTLFMFIAVFAWLGVFVYEILLGQGNVWIAVPWSSNANLLEAYVLPAWVLLYSLLAIPFGTIITRVLKYVRFRRRLEEMGLPLDADGSGAG